MTGEHEIMRLQGGHKETSWIQPACSCGWFGKKEYAYNDYQHTNVKEDIQEHLRKEYTPISDCG